jgi:hypothetical protein
MQPRHFDPHSPGKVSLHEASFPIGVFSTERCLPGSAKVLSGGQREIRSEKYETKPRSAFISVKIWQPPWLVSICCLHPDADIGFMPVV